MNAVLRWGSGITKYFKQWEEDADYNFRLFPVDNQLLYYFTVI
jgi:hypothetical protein